MSTESKIEKALFRFLRENERIPTRMELVEVAHVRSADFERIASKNELFKMLWSLTAEEQAAVLERIESDEGEGEGPYTLPRLMYLIIEVQLTLLTKSLDRKG